MFLKDYKCKSIFIFIYIMEYYYYDDNYNLQQGVGIGKTFKKLGRDIKKGFKKNISNPIEKNVIKPISKNVIDPSMEGFTTMGSTLGKFTNDELLPSVVSVGIPLTSSMVGVLGTQFGIPPEITTKATQRLLEANIPKKFQKDNKYLDLATEGIQAGLSGDPMDLQRFENSALNTLRGSGIRRNLDNPYDDMIQLMLRKYEINPYSNDDIIGEGVKKKRRGRKKKNELLEVVLKKQPKYKKFSHAQNSALDQLIEAKMEREYEENKKAMKNMVDKQTNLLTALGFGIKPRNLN